jgi:hypothetical protein
VSASAAGSVVVLHGCAVCSLGHVVNCI